MQWDTGGQPEAPPSSVEALPRRVWLSFCSPHEGASAAVEVVPGNKGPANRKFLKSSTLKPKPRSKARQGYTADLKIFLFFWGGASERTPKSEDSELFVLHFFFCRISDSCVRRFRFASSNSRIEEELTVAFNEVLNPGCRFWLVW